MEGKSCRCLVERRDKEQKMVTEMDRDTDRQRHKEIDRQIVKFNFRQIKI